MEPTRAPALRSEAPVVVKPQTEQPPLGQGSTNPTSWLRIDLGQLRRNVASFRSLLNDANPAEKPASLCAVVKSNAYGLGAVPLGRSLAAAGVDFLAVYSLSQAAELIRAGIDTPILGFMPVRDLPNDPDMLDAIRHDRLHLAVYDLPQLTNLNHVASSHNIALPLHFYLDSGMSRGGLSQTDFAAALRAAADLPNLRVAGVYTHMAAADVDPDFSFAQLKRFNEALEHNRKYIPQHCLRHAANTYSTLRDAAFHLDMVRIGLGLYGYGPESCVAGSFTSRPDRALPVVRWLSRIAHVHDVKSGSGVGYNLTHQVDRDSRLGIVPVGYGDGYPLTASNRGPCVQIHVDPELANNPTPERQPPVTVPVLGKVNMDQLIVDLTNYPQLHVNALVEVISSDVTSPCSLPSLAQQAGSSCYEMLTRLSPRLPRLYVAE